MINNVPPLNDSERKSDQRIDRINIDSTRVSFQGVTGIRGLHGTVIGIPKGKKGRRLKYVEYNYSSSYNKNDIVYYHPDASEGPLYFWSGSNQNEPEKEAYMYPGTYICVQSVATPENRPSGSFQVPYYPWNIVEEDNYFNLISMFPVSMSVCIGVNNEQKTYWIEGTEHEPDTVNETYHIP